MFIELVDSLRCPRPHAESWLVLGAERMNERDVVEGVLGCPVCEARYPIAGGIADLRADRTVAEGAAGQPIEPHTDDAEQAMRLAAFLNLTDGGGYVALVGAYTRYATAVRMLADAQLLLVNPMPGTAMGGGISGVRVHAGLPVAPGSARGVACDASVDSAFLAQAVRGVQPRGRIVAPAALALPDGVTELARDATVWVGEREPETGPLIALERGGR